MVINVLTGFCKLPRILLNLPGFGSSLDVGVGTPVIVGVGLVKACSTSCACHRRQAKPQKFLFAFAVLVCCF